MKRSLANKFPLGEKGLVARRSTQTRRSTFGVMNAGYPWRSRRSPIGPDVPLAGHSGRSGSLRYQDLVNVHFHFGRRLTPDPLRA